MNNPTPLRWPMSVAQPRWAARRGDYVNKEQGTTGKAPLNEQPPTARTNNQQLATNNQRLL